MSWESRASQHLSVGLGILLMLLCVQADFKSESWLQVRVSDVKRTHGSNQNGERLFRQLTVLFLNYMTILCRTQRNQHKQKPDLFFSALMSIQPKKRRVVCVCVCLNERTLDSPLYLIPNELHFIVLKRLQEERNAGLSYQPAISCYSSIFMMTERDMAAYQTPPHQIIDNCRIFMVFLRGNGSALFTLW